MKTVIKTILRKLIFNDLLRFKKVKPNTALFIITETQSDNCLALSDYIMNNVHAIKVYYLVDDSIYNDYIERFKESSITIISAGHNSFKANYCLITSKYVFYMHRRPFSIINKRRDQMVINLWHGSGYKNVADNEGDWHDGRDFDYVLVPGKVFIETKSKFFSCKKSRILPLGYPRYDFYKTINDNTLRFVEMIKKDNENKLIIWMPTYRKKEYSKADSGESRIEYSFDIPLIQSEEELMDINQVCKDNKIVILVKRHPYQKEYKCEHSYYSNIRFIGNSDLIAQSINLYQLLAATDALISDYSSVAIDYLLLNKPIAFSLDDYEQYKNLRGFVFSDPLKYMPGMHLYTHLDMIDFIIDVSKGNDRFLVDRNSILPEVHNVTSNYCERIWKTILNLEGEES